MEFFFVTSNSQCQEIEPCEVWYLQHVWACWRHYLPLSHWRQGIEPCEVWDPQMFGLVGDIPPQVGQPTFISIARNKSYTDGFLI